MMKHLSCLTLAALLVSGCAAWRQLFGFEELPSSMPPGSVHVPAAYGKAIGIAMADFLAERRQEAEEVQTLTPDAGEERAAMDTPATEGKEDAGVEEAPPLVDAGVQHQGFIQGVSECFARPEAYDTFVGFIDDKYIVRVFPVSERCFETPTAIHDLGANYEIDARTYVILKKEKLE